MKSYKIAFVGLGSIAKRHLRNVHAFLSSRGDCCTVDLYRSSLTHAMEEDLKPLVGMSYLYADPLPSDRQYDAVFVTNPTAMHYETVMRFANHTASFFIEKPVFDCTEVDESIFKVIENKPCYVACPLRYNAVLQYVKTHVNLDEVLSARAISSSYLPEWRPGQDYRNTYSAHKDMGGGVSIDLIHEWDYLTHLFGFPEECFVIQSKISDLEIDSDDIAVYVARQKNRTIELHLDYFGRKSIRVLELFTKDDTIRCDLLAGTIAFLKENKMLTLEAERNAFQTLEIEHFFNIIDGAVPNDSTPEHAYSVLKLAKGIVS